MTGLFITLGILAVLVIAALIFTALFFQGALGRKREDGKTSVDTASLMPGFAPYRDAIRRDKAWYQAQPRRTVSIRSHDGLTLYADVLEAENAVATVLLMHGYRGSGASDFSMVLPFYHRNHINIVCPDQRACGRSEGKYITLGALERHDCRRWLDFIGEEFGKDLPIIMDGVSMGASTVLLATALDAPKNLKGVIADCGFTSAWEIVKMVLRSTKAIPVFPFAWIARPISHLLAHFGLKDADTREAMKQCSVPIFFAHGKADRFVPYEMSVQNYEVCTAPKELFLVDEAEHGMCFLLEQEAYEHKILTFFEQCFGFQKTSNMIKESDETI